MNIEERDTAAGDPRCRSQAAARPRRRQQPAPARRRPPRLPGLLDALRSIGFDGWLTLECALDEPVETTLRGSARALRGAWERLDVAGATNRARGGGTMCPPHRLPPRGRRSLRRPTLAPRSGFQPQLARITSYRDLNHNGRLDPYEDARLPVEDRVADLLARMTIEEKVGLMFQPWTRMNRDGTIARRTEGPGLETASALIGKRGITHLHVLFDLAPPRKAAQWQNAIQRLAEETRLGIPVTLSSDPRQVSPTTLARACARQASRVGPSRSASARSGTSSSSVPSPRRSARSTARLVYASRCIRWPILRPIRGGLEPRGRSEAIDLLLP